MGYGFRVFDLEVVHGPRDVTRLEMASPRGDGVHLIDHVERIFTSQIDTLLSGTPDLPNWDTWKQPAPVPRSTPQVKVTKVERQAPGKLFLEFGFGHHGVHDEADGEDGPVDLTRRAALAPFRALLYTPDKGKMGRLVVETVESTCPSAVFTVWFGYLCALEMQAALDAAKRTPAGAKLKKTPRRWIRLYARQLADKERVREMIENSDQIVVELTERQPAKPGSKRTKITTRLRQTIGPTGKGKKLVKEAVSWLDGGGKAGYVQRIEKLAGYSPDKLDRASLAFNEAAIEVVVDGKPKKIRPSTVRDKFTYEVTANYRPADDVWFQAVQKVLVGPMSADTDITL